GDHQKAIPLLEASKLWPEPLGVGAPYGPDKRRAGFLLAGCWLQGSDPATARAHWEAVREHRLEGTRSGPPAVLTAGALQEREREEALAKLLGSLEADAPRDSMAALVLALYHGEKDKAGTLADKTDIEPKLYQILSRP